MYRLLLTLDPFFHNLLLSLSLPFIRPLASIWAWSVSGFTTGQGRTATLTNIRPQNAWFLWWLLLFNLWYVFVVTEKDGRSPEGYKLPLSKHFKDIPKSCWARWLVGAIQGILQLICNWFLFATWNTPTEPMGGFASMVRVLACTFILYSNSATHTSHNFQSPAFFFPYITQPINTGTFVSYLLLFYIGLLAGENKWFDPEKPKICERLGMNVWLFRIVVFGEYILFGLGMTYQDDIQATIGLRVYWFIMYIIGGLMTIDISLVMLELFQSHFDYTNALLTWLARSAYGAYLLENLL